MKFYARVSDDKVAEIVKVKAGDDIADMFTAELVATMVEVASNVKEGWVREGDGFVEPPVDVPSQERLLAYAADRRWRIEVGGIVIAGVPIATDDRSKIMIMGARVAAAANPDWETVWHGADGQTYPLNAAAMIAISNAVEAHVNATFATFAGVKVDIESAAIDSFAAIDAAFAGGA